MSGEAEVSSASAAVSSDLPPKPSTSSSKVTATEKTTVVAEAEAEEDVGEDPADPPMAAAATTTTTAADGCNPRPRRRPRPRPLSTVGIGPVFVSCPPPTTSPSTSSSATSTDTKTTTTTEQRREEIVGTVKSVPEDFVVREIGGVPPRRWLDASASADGADSLSPTAKREPRVAELTDAETLPPEPPEPETERGGSISSPALPEDGDAAAAGRGGDGGEGDGEEIFGGGTEKKRARIESIDDGNGDDRDPAGGRGDDVATQDANVREEEETAIGEQERGKGREEGKEGGDPDGLDNDDESRRIADDDDEVISRTATSAEEAVGMFLLAAEEAASASAGGNHRDQGGGEGNRSDDVMEAAEGGGDCDGGSGDGDTPSSSSSLLESVVALHDAALRRLPAGPFGEEGAGEGTEGAAEGNEDVAARKDASQEEESAFVWIPPLDERVHVVVAKVDDEAAATGSDGRERSDRGNNNRGTFHRSLREAFPLLRAETVAREESPPLPAKKEAEDNVAGDCRRKWICVEKDPSFLPLVPYLERPREDVVGLYRFRNRGCRAASTPSSRSYPENGREEGGKDGDVPRIRGGGGRDRGRGRGRGGFGGRGRGRRNYRGGGGRGRGGRGGRGGGGSFFGGDGGSNVGGQILLRLRPGLDKDDRRTVHRIVAEACRDFETGTTTTTVDSTGGEEGEATATSSASGVGTATAIVVKWCRRVQRAALASAKKKSSRTASSGAPAASVDGSRKRKASSGTAADGDGRPRTRRPPHTLCVVRKAGVEHLTALHHLSFAVRCRPSDVGLAGIKDMRAVTYQFCTFRNQSPFKVRKANAYLRERGMEVGNFERVDWVLNTGDLRGNKFEVTVRDLRGVHRRSEDEDEETTIPCTRAYLDARVLRVRSAGFVNFYGEQRVGSAGFESEVGVRSFQIGRAMLRRDFAGAIDLMMRGRRLGRDGRDFAESEEVRRVREVWVESGGDPTLTLKAFPKGREASSLARERTVLKGLKRYGKDRPLDALRCLQHSVRTFWINAYQSYVWNKMASERIQRFGTEGGVAVPGDLYVDDPSDKGAGRAVMVVNKENTSGVKLSQVVLPLPGYDVQYPANGIGESYRRTLDGDGVVFGKDAPPEATAKGAYRALIGNAGTLDWQAVEEEEEGGCNADDDDENGGNGEEVVSAAKFTFELGSGSYATMLLRELMLTTAAR